MSVLTVTLAGVTPIEVTLLQDAGILNDVDLGTLSVTDFDVILPNSTIVARRRLHSIGQYVSSGGTITEATTMLDILTRINAPQVAVQPNVNANHNAFSDQSSRGAPKIHVGGLTDFGGTPIKWEDWRVNAKATLGQTIYATLLSTAPDDDDQLARTRDRELYFMFQKALYQGSAYHIVESTANLESGNQVWVDLNQWYGSNEVSRTVIDYYRDKLLALRLTETTQATEYVNEFILCSGKLEEKNEGWTAATKLTTFLDGIKDDDYDVVIQHLRGTPNITFQDAIQRIRSREQELLKLGRDATSKARRAPKTNGNGYNSALRNKTSDDKPTIPSIPDWLLQSIPSHATRKDFIRWRGVYNSESRHLRADERTSTDSATAGTKNKSRKTKYQSEDDTSVGSENKRRSKKHKKTTKSRRTKTSSNGLNDYNSVSKSVIPQVHLKSSDDDEDDSDCDDKEYDSDVNNKSSSKTSKKRQRQNETKKLKKGRRTPVVRRGRTDDEPPRVVLDEGTELEVIGGIGWVVLEELSKSASMGGWRVGMEGPTLPLVNAVCAYERQDGTAILLGLGAAAWDDRPEQTESLVNTHVMRNNNVIVDNVSKRDGGLQRLKVGNEEVHLEFSDNEKLLTFVIRKPTDFELDNLPVNWLTPRIPINSTQLLRHSLRRERGNVTSENPIDWERQLGHPPEAILAKTIAATTQLCIAPIEMENRVAPRQHRKQRLLPLHPRRLEGRTDSDTFFSSVKSIRGYTCAQLFFHVGTGYLFVRCMRRESHSHGAYQDYIRYVGAPNVLLTDNSRTQIGAKWTKTSRENITKQIQIAPHNQQQNQAERKIRDIKTRVLVALRLSNAPIEFWCYCMLWIVDCFNHTAVQGLEWQTPTGLLNGVTPDISMFRFGFFDPVWYYEPTAKYPEPSFCPGRFVGIAWDHGDAFTYRIWTCPKGNWIDGTELIRNIVKPRDSTSHSIDGTRPTSEHDLEFTIRTHNKKRKRNTNRKGKQQPSNDAETPPVIDVPLVASDTPRYIPATTEAGWPPTATLPTVDIPPPPAPSTVVTFADPISTPLECTTPEEHGGIVETTESDKEIDDPLTTIATIEMVDEVNDELAEERINETQVGGSNATVIDGHRWKDGQLQLRVRWDTGEPNWEHFRLMKVDHPQMTAAYLIEHKVTRSKRDGVDRNLQWAQKTLRDIKRAVRRIANIYEFQLDANDDVFKVRRSDASRKKKKKQRPKEVLKYGVVVPRNVKEAFDLDSKNGNAFWRNAIKAEIDSLISMECFEFHEKGHKPGNDYQWTTLTMIFDVKQDLRRKARLVAGGHLVDSLDNNVYSSTVKGISVRILYVIAHKRNLKLLCGDVGNAYVNAYTNEKVYSHCGMEFGPDCFGKTITIKKALYGLRTSSERWWSHFADTLRGLNFRSARYDKDVWIRLSKDGTHYEYVCTHSDDFMIAARKPQAIMDAIKETYNVKSEGPPNYYLGNDYKQDKKGRWCFGCKRYIKEALVRVEQMFGTLTKSTVPILHGDHPELDESELLDDSGHRKYQMLIGILNWIVTIGRFDVTFATMSLSRFTSCPRKGHLDRALKIFGYLKRKPNRRICVDSSDPKYSGFESEFSKDYTQLLADEYPDSSEEIDSKVPKPLIDEMKITAFVDSDHAHDKVTRRSVTGLIILVGRTPVFFSSKRQGAIETSTYGAEFCAMRTAVEELMSVRYMLRCLGVKVEHASYLFGDNLGVVQNATIKESLLKKKHVAISYHKVREAAASGIVHPTKIDGKFNFADVCTKAQTNAIFHTLCGGLMYG